MSSGGTFGGFGQTPSIVLVLTDLQNHTSQVHCTLLDLQVMARVVHGLSVEQASWVNCLVEDDAEDGEEEEAIEEYCREE